MQYEQQAAAIAQADKGSISEEDDRRCPSPNAQEASKILIIIFCNA
jgi:hypothetical protein